MLDINLIRSDSAKVSAALAKKGYTVDFAEMLGWDAERKAAKQSVEELKAKRNKVSAEIPKLKKAGEPVEKIFEEMRALGDEIAAEDARIAELEGKINDFLLGLPNMPDDDLLAGEKENNQVIKVVGKPTEFGFKPKNHVDLCVDLGLIDYERGVKLSVGRRLLALPRHGRATRMGASQLFYRRTPQGRLRIHTSSPSARL